jgi:adenine deaminase
MPIITANLVDIFNRNIFPARVEFENSQIRSITKVEAAEDYILPGFVDSHIHIESSMLIPSEFASIAVKHGTVGTVSDPHEIGNVLGIEGVNFMTNNGSKVPFKFNFGAPSCVPATNFETAGAKITSAQIDALMARPDIKYLSEMMNWPGVVYDDLEVHEKIMIAHKHNKPIDGHAPGLTGELAEKYISAGISTDHECVTYEEALGKIKHGMKISIREGSAARNYEALSPLIDEYPDMVMLCSDDKHPDELVVGHINLLVKRSIANGYDLFNVLQVACINPVQHYNLDIGMLREGDPADFIVVNNLEEFNIRKTYIDGKLVAEDGRSFVPKISETPLNNFKISPIRKEELQIEAKSDKIRVIEALDGQLITKEIEATLPSVNGQLQSDPEKDILKLVVVNRYSQSPPAVGFIKNFGIKSGAIASSVGHDSHNITAVGVNDNSLSEAINLVIDNKGGISAVGNDKQFVLPLPYAGLMTDVDGYSIANQYTEIDAFVKTLGSDLRAPFMTLSFMALLVIPDLKLSDLGLFSGNKFEFVDLFVGE